jgi:hypothetical protein
MRLELVNRLRRTVIVMSVGHAECHCETAWSFRGLEDKGSLQCICASELDVSDVLKMTLWSDTSSYGGFH